MNSANKSGHLNVKIKTTVYLLHRLAWLYVYGEMPKSQIDHINGIQSDNRICNLRLSTNSENQQSQFRAKKGNSSGYLGVSKHSQGRWLCQIVVNGTHHYLGLYDDPKEAHEVYLDAKARLHPVAELTRNRKNAKNT